MKHIIIYFLIFLSFTGHPIKAQEKVKPLTLLTEKAISVNPEIKKLKARWEAARQNIRIGTNLADPELNIGIINVPVNTFSLNQEAMTAKIAGITQRIPYPGSLKAKAKVKSMDTAIITRQIEDLKNRIIYQVSFLYYNLQEIRREKELTQQSIQLLKQISNVVKRKYEVGSATLQQIIQVEVRITQLKDKLQSLSGDENDQEAQINALLYNKTNTKIKTGAIENTGAFNLKADSLLETAKNYRPLLNEIQLFKKKADLIKKEARYAFYPNFKVGIQYSQRGFKSLSGINYPDFLGVVVGISIPVNYGGKKTAKVNKAKYLQEEYIQQYNTSIQTLRQNFGKLISLLKSLKERESLLAETLLPQSIQSYKASLADYQVNKIDFVNVIQAEDNILKVKTSIAKLRTNYKKKLAQIEFLSGKNIIQINKK